MIALITEAFACNQTSLGEYALSWKAGEKLCEVGRCFSGGEMHQKEIRKISTMSISLNRKHVLFYQVVQQAELDSRNVAELMITTEFELTGVNVKKSSFSLGT